MLFDPAVLRGTDVLPTPSQFASMWAVLSKLSYAKFTGLGSFIVIGACILAASVAMLPALPQSGDPVPFDAGYLEAAAFIDVSMQAIRQDAATESDQQAPPLFGMETEPVAGEVAANGQPVKADIDREQQVLARCRAREACPVVAQKLLDIVAASRHSAGVRSLHRSRPEMRSSRAYPTMLRKAWLASMILP